MIENVINYLFAPFTITTGHSTKNIQTKNKKDNNSKHSTIDFATNKDFACARPEHNRRKMQNYQKTTQNIGNNQGRRAYIPLPVP